jgi:hypothetical protein
MKTLPLHVTLPIEVIGLLAGAHTARRSALISDRQHQGAIAPPCRGRPDAASAESFAHQDYDEDKVTMRPCKANSHTFHLDASILFGRSAMALRLCARRLSRRGVD